jgi:hypothetical protein
MCSVCFSRAAGAALQGGAGKASKQRVTVSDACAVREQGGCAPTRLQIAEVSILRGGARHVRHARAATQREFFLKNIFKKTCVSHSTSVRHARTATWWDFSFFGLRDVVVSQCFGLH